MMKLFVLCLVLVVYSTTPTEAHSDGALAESCFDHAINHTDRIAPPNVYASIVFENCSDPCIYQLSVNRYKNDDGDLVELSDGPFGPGDNFIYEYGTTYEVVLSSEGIGFVGFLVQARGGDSPTFSSDRTIVGIWNDTGVNETLYKTLSCPTERNMTEKFENSVTQQLNTNLRGVLSVSMLWTAPASEGENVTFFYTVVQQVRRVFHLLSGPILLAPQPEPTTPPVLPTTSGATDSPNVPSALGTLEIGIIGGLGGFALVLLVVGIVVVVIILAVRSKGKTEPTTGKNVAYEKSEAKVFL